MKTHKLLEKHDIIELKKGHTVNAKIPARFAFPGVFEWKLVQQAITIGEELHDAFKTTYLVGTYIVTETKVDRSGRKSSRDQWPDAFQVFCTRLKGNQIIEGEEVNFYQTGAYPGTIRPEQIQAVRKAQVATTITSVK